VTLTRAGSGPAPDAGDPRIVQLAIRASF
jgi:hypothetical protein